jgi:hypothetical protein
MAQITFADGDVPTAAQLNTYALGEGGAWTSWTPAVVQSGSVTVTNTRSRYARYGRLIVFTVDLAVTGAGTAANAISVSLPATAADANSVTGGTGYVTDDSTATIYPFQVFPFTTTTFRLKSSTTASGSGLLGVIDFTGGLTSGDLIRCTGQYEAAS